MRGNMTAEFTQKKYLFCLFSAFFVLCSIGLWMGRENPPEQTGMPAGEDTEAAEQKGVTVYVTGAVRHPGVYDLAPGARVADALKAAGDVIPYASLEKINLALPAEDGLQIAVPLHPEGEALPAGTAGSSLIRINTATEAELDTIPGVGASTAKKIIEYRDTHGFFQTKEELMKIPGIGEGKFRKMENGITL